MFDFKATSRTRQGVEERLTAINTEVADLQAHRRRILAAPATKGDVKTALARLVDHHGAGFAGDLRGQLSVLVNNTNTAMNLPTMSAMPIGLARPAAVSSRFSDDGNRVDLDRMLCCLFGPQVKAALSSVVDGMEWPVEGLPISARVDEVRRLDAQIEQLLAEGQELRRQASEAGLSLGN